jgi:predicted NodU family carbamoyl transferase
MSWNDLISIPFVSHDYNTYDGKLHKQFKRLYRYEELAFDEFIKTIYELINDSNNISTSVMPNYYAHTDEKFYIANDDFFKEGKKLNVLVNKNKPIDFLSYLKLDNIYYIDHHIAHAAHAFLSSDYEKSDILAIDGGGKNYRTIFITSENKFLDLSKELSLGALWELISGIMFNDNSAAGKVMGLAAYGNIQDDIYTLLEEFLIFSGKVKKQYTNKLFIQELELLDYKDLACTLQKITLDKVKEYIIPLKTSDNICVSGGVAYNGYMNELLTKYWCNVHVPPACGDEGISLGCYMHADYVINNNRHVPNVYSGIEYEIKE